jgi:hypothetical protein
MCSCEDKWLLKGNAARVVARCYYGMAGLDAPMGGGGGQHCC